MSAAILVRTIEIRLLDKCLLRQIYFHLFSSLCFSTFCTKHWFFSTTFTTSASGTSCTICMVREILLWEPLKDLIILELFTKGKTFKYHKSCLWSLEKDIAIPYCICKWNTFLPRKSINISLSLLWEDPWRDWLFLVSVPSCGFVVYKEWGRAQVCVNAVSAASWHLWGIQSPELCLLLLRTHSKTQVSLWYNCYFHLCLLLSKRVRFKKCHA